MSEEIKKEAQDAELSLKELGEITGGYIFCCNDNGIMQWQLINDSDGSVMARFATRDEAVYAAKMYGIKEKEISLAGLNLLRNMSKL